MSYHPNPHGGGPHSNGFLPSSAPVSSLLPPIPTSQPQQQHLNNDPLAALSSALTSSTATAQLHQQLAALLQGGSVTPAVSSQPPPPQQQVQQQVCCFLGALKLRGWCRQHPLPTSNWLHTSALVPHPPCSSSWHPGQGVQGCMLGCQQLCKRCAGSTWAHAAVTHTSESLILLHRWCSA